MFFECVVAALKMDVIVLFSSVNHEGLLTGDYYYYYRG